jgi:diguanylate cyclase (GGDEF)-like protein
LLLLSSLLAAYWIAVKISAPVKILVEQVKAITDGNYSATLEFSSNDELGQLAEEFNLMKDAINKREQTISLQAFHDQLTKLPNRYSLLKTLEKWLTSFSEPFAVIRISPQRMKEVNYSLGHDVGDDVIIELANRLMFCSENNYIYNVGGSSFVLIVKGVNKVKLNHFLTEIEEIMEAEFKLKNILLNIQIKMGISLYPDHSSNNQELLAMASTALQYAQKKNVHHIIYEEHLSSLTIERLHLINGLKSAISENQLVLFYQPKLDLKKGLVTEVEALVRWIHPEHGLIPPDNFISLAEQTGYIHQLTAWVIDTALAQYKLWRHQGIKLAIAVNVSAENLKLTNFYENVIILLEKHNLTPEALCIEITESVVLEDPDATIELLTRFKNRGFHLSVDDYGTGYSSLAQLTKLPVCEMKIDKAFVSDLIDKQENRVIVDSTISLAHALNLNVVAEGIEDQATLEWLTNNNCDMAQGYFISKPKPIDELNTWLAQSKYFHTKPNLVRLKDE